MNSTELTWSVSEILNTSPIAVVILNQPIFCTANMLLPLWERALVRVTVDGGSNRWRTFEKSLPALSAAPSPPHYVTGDLDSINPDTEAYLRSKDVTFIPTPDQDETDFTKALRTVGSLLQEKQLSIDYVVCICEHAGRLDQTMANLETLHLVPNWGSHWRPVILAQNTLTWLLAPGRHCIKVPDICVEGTLPCGLIPLCGPTTVSTKGLKWDLDEGVLSFGALVSTSNSFVRTNIEVETQSNLVWTMQFLQDHSSP